MVKLRIGDLKEPANPYFLAQTLTGLALAVPHAILTPILFSKGLTLSQILTMQAIYSLAVLSFELPSGALADMISRRYIYLSSRLLLVFYFLLVVHGSGFLVLSVAWGLYGVASALDSGTLDAALVNNAKARASGEKEYLEPRLSWLVRREKQSNFVGMMIGSSVGALSYLHIGVNIYYISVLSVLVAIFSIVVFFRIPEQYNSQGNARGGLIRQLKKHVEETLSELKRSPDLKNFLALAVLVQAFMQLHFQLWQATALEKGVQEKHLLFLYLIFIALSLAASMIPVESLFAHRGFVKVLALVFFLCSGLVIVLPHLWYLLSYCVLVFLLTVVGNYCIVGIRTSASVARIGAVTSLVSLSSRIGAIMVLLVSTMSIRVYAPSHVVGVGFVILLFLSLLWLGVRRGHE